MKYEYSQTNRLESPCFYMYTKYYGKEFLKAYFSNRIAIINNYNIKEEDYLAKIYEESRQSLKYFSRNKDSTSYQLICLLIDMIESDKNKKNNTVNVILIAGPILMIYDRPNLVFPGIKHAHLLKTKFVGLNVHQIKSVDLMPRKTKVGR